MKPDGSPDDPELERPNPGPRPSETPTGVSDASQAEGSVASRGAPGIYEVGELLGRGGMGDVVLAHDPKIGRDVALKRMRTAQPSPEMIERFLREAKVQARLDHPAIVPVHELGCDSDGLPYFTMKRLAGTTLAAVLESRAAPLKQLLRAFIDVCLAVELAHSRGVVHRDLKPSNVMLGDYGEVYVLDWGVARIVGAAELAQVTTQAEIPTFDGHTRGVQLLGTPGYMAPEQVLGEQADPPADVYALGSILFEILTGQSLHPPGIAALVSTLEGLDASPARRTPEHDIAPELDTACIAALAHDACARPSPRGLADRVQAYLDGDRDLEQRRALAQTWLARAREALASGESSRRADAVLAAGRALAFDQESSEALDLVTSLIVEPPKETPVEATDAIDAEEVRLSRERSRRAIVPVLSFYAIVPLVVVLGSVRWPPLVGMCIAVGGLSAMSYVNWRIRVLPGWLFPLAHVLFVVMFTRVAGIFLVTPMLIAALLLTLTSTPWVAERRWVVTVWTLLAVLVPLGLEWLDVFAPTWRMTSEGLLSFSALFVTRPTHEVFLIIASNAAIALVVGHFALGISRDRRDAQRRLQVQTWHLQQLLPRAAAPRRIVSTDEPRTTTPDH